VGNSLTSTYSQQGAAPCLPGVPEEAEACFPGINWTNWDLFRHK